MSLEELQEPASPGARVMQTPGFNLCIVTVMGYTATIDVDIFKQEVERTLAKHPRFSSLLVANDKTRKMSWQRTNLDLEKHIFSLDLDPNMENPDKFVEDFTSDLLAIPLDMTKPLWEFHILNVKTSYANATAIFKIHHSIGDGLSLISLLMACGQKTSNPESSTVIVPSKKQKPVRNHGLMKRFLLYTWTMMLVIFNTLTGCAILVLTLLFLKDSKTPIKGGQGIELFPKRFVHRAISLDDVKLVKNAMDVTINDVLLGMAEAGLSLYLNKRYEKMDKEKGSDITNKTNYLPRNLRLRSATIFKLRPPMTVEELTEMLDKGHKLNGKWGNECGIVILPLTMTLEDDPLTHIRRSKAKMDRKKLSLEFEFSYFALKLLLKLFGLKVAGEIVRIVFNSTTLSFSNVPGPREDYILFGHRLCYMVPSVYGAPQSLVIHCQSYANKLIIMLAADENKIPNPHELCDDLVKSFENIKEAVINRGLAEII